MFQDKEFPFVDLYLEKSEGQREEFENYAIPICFFVILFMTFVGCAHWQLNREDPDLVRLERNYDDDL